VRDAAQRRSGAIGARQGPARGVCKPGHAAGHRIQVRARGRGLPKQEPGPHARPVRLACAHTACLQCVGACSLLARASTRAEPPRPRMPAAGDNSHSVIMIASNAFSSAFVLSVLRKPGIDT